MFKRSIEQVLVQNQDSKKSNVDYIYARVVFLENGNIECPLCDHQHENNTFCQQ